MPSKPTMPKSNARANRSRNCKMPHIDKMYIDTDAGPVHVRIAPAAHEVATPLICLHPAPSSGLYFESVLPLLNASRTVFAPDYPGYGGSYALQEAPTIADYANSILQVIDGLKLDGPVDILGFHTGCLVAVELGLIAPGRIRKTVLCDVPYFTKDVRPSLREKVAQPLKVTPELNSIESAWKFNVSNRIQDVPIERALALLAEQLRSGTHDYFAFDAAFSYPCEERFAKSQAEAVVIATQSGLLEPSRAGARAIRNATLVEAPEINGAVFEASAKQIVSRILTALDEPE